MISVQRNKLLVFSIFSILIVGFLVATSIFACNYTVLSSGSLATDPTLSQELHAATIFIGVNQTISLNVTTERIPWTGSYKIMFDTQPLVYNDEVEPDGSNLTVGNGFDAPINAITLNDGVIQRMFLGLNISSGNSCFTGYGLFDGRNFTLTGVSPALELLVHGPNGEVSESSLQWKTNNHTTQYSVLPRVNVTEPGTYKLDLYYGKQGGIANWNGYLTLNASWQSLDRPYFYYGLAGLAISIGYVVFALLQVRQIRAIKQSYSQET
jgi:hypothetical protein